MIDVKSIRRQLPDGLIEQLKTYALTDILAAIVPQPIHGEAAPAGVFGNVFFRPVDLPEFGSMNHYQGHAHHYDHVSLLSRGSVNLRAWPVDPRTGEAIGPAIERQFSAELEPAFISIKRHWAHEFTALEPGTRIDCVFAMRNYEGEVVQDWNGNLHATE